jgi:hypothetical protein
LPICWRLTLFNALAIGAILLVSSLALFFLLRGALFSELEKTVKDRAVTAAREVEAGEELDAGNDELTLDEVFVVVRDGQGRVLSRTTELGGAENNVWRRAGVGAGGGWDSGALRGRVGLRLRHAGEPFGRGRVVEAGKSYDDAQEVLDTFAGLLALIVLVALLLSEVGAYLMARGLRSRRSRMWSGRRARSRRETCPVGCRW